MNVLRHLQTVFVGTHHDKHATILSVIKHGLDRLTTMSLIIAIKSDSSSLGLLCLCDKCITGFF